MNALKFQFEMLEEARLFMKSIPTDARNKIYYNIRKASCGIIDPEIFKKLENADIWEFRTLYNRIVYIGYLLSGIVMLKHLLLLPMVLLRKRRKLHQKK